MGAKAAHKTATGPEVLSLTPVMSYRDQGEAGNPPELGIAPDQRRCKTDLMGESLRCY